MRTKSNKSLIKKKILYVILNGPEYGGSEKHVLDIINNIDEKKYEPYLICSIGNDISKKIDNKYKDNIFEIERGITSIFKIYKISNKIKSDIIHAHAARAIVLTRLTYLLRKLTFKSGKLICTAHGWVLEYLKHKKIYERMFLLFRRLDYKTLAVSKFSMNEMIEKGYKENKMMYIYNGIDNSKIIENSKLKESVSNINYIGRFTNQKGIKYLMEAIKRMSKDNSIKFNIYGKGELEDFIKSEINTNNLTNVNLKGYIDSKDVKSVLDETDVLLLPSIDEGLPYILVEAISSGVPCIASDVGGVSEVIINEKNGLLIEKKNVDSICSAIEKIKGMDIKQMSIECKNQAKNFSINNMLEKLEALYDECIEKK